MPVYQVGSKEYELPDGLSRDDLGYALQALYLRDNPQEQTEQQSPASPSQPFNPPANDIDPDTLSQDSDWLRATKAVYQLNEGQDWQGEDKDLAEYGLDYMGWFNYNLPKMTFEANQLRSAPQEQKEAFLYLMDAYDNLNLSWGGVGRFFKGVLADPTTYVGLATLGIGTAATQGTKQATKAGIKELLKQGMRTGVIAGTEGAIYAGTDNLIRQNIEVDAGRKSEIDGTELTLTTGAGALLGFAGGTVLDAASNKISGMFKSGQNQVDTEAMDGVTTRTLKELSEKYGKNPDQSASESTLVTTTRQAQDAAEGVVLPNTTIDDLNVPALKTPVPFESVSIDDQKIIARDIAEELANLDTVQVESVIDDLATSKFTAKELNRFKTAVGLARDDVAKDVHAIVKDLKATTDPNRQAELFHAYEDNYRQLGNLMKLDEPLASDSGQVLGIRSRFLDLKDVNMDDPDSFLRVMDGIEQRQEVNNVKSSYDDDIKTAEDAGDWAEAARLKVLRGLEVDDEFTNILTKDGLPEGKVKRYLMKFNEMAISNVFSATTVAINLVPSGIKTVLRPAMDALLSDPFEEATRRQMVATYSAMRSSIGSAAKAAVAAFRYEQSVLTRESGRLMEGELAMGGGKVSGKVAGAIRTLPRILNASDEFLSQIGYQGFIAGEATAGAYKEGLASGLKGKRLDSFVRKHVEAELKQSYGSLDSKEALRTVINKGRNLGHRGEALSLYVKREVERSQEALKHGTNDEALNYVRDLLYKRRFSGDGALSSMAKRYEEFVAEQPWMRVVGQLFFRTPVRVFEEGIRMTPGVQILAPNFMSDLAGKNGRLRQVKARGEALASFTITGWIMQEYAKGNLVGDGAYDG